MSERPRPFGSSRERFERTRSAESGGDVGERLREASPIERLAFLWLLWFAAWFVLGAAGPAEGDSALLAGTVDRVDSLPVKLVFLNLPLQMMLALSALLTASSPYPTVRRVGAVLAIAVTLLILIHLVISFVTALA